MGSAPVVVHRPSQSGGRRVTVHRHGRDEILEAAEVIDPERVLDDPRWVEWRGGGPHQWSAA
ncbi:hypothetical protein [Streptomyces chryseus]